MMSSEPEFEEEFLFPTPEQFYKANYEQIHILCSTDALPETPPMELLELQQMEVIEMDLQNDLLAGEPEPEPEPIASADDTAAAVASIQEQTAAPVCSLCLRRCRQELAIQFATPAECQEKLKSVLHLKLDLATDGCHVCRTCWKLVETIADFKECCMKAAKGTKKIASGLAYQEETDSWLDAGMAELVSHMQQTVQGQMERIDQAVKNAPKRRRRDVIIIPFPEPEPAAEPESAGKDKSENAILEIAVQSCHKCQRRFDTESGLRIHTARCKGPGDSEDAWRTCSVCSASFKGVVQLNYHMNKHKGIKPFTCRKQCEKTFYSAMTRINHEKSCGSTGRICQICGAQLKSEGTLKNHMAYIHGHASLPCSECNQLFKSQKALRRHVLVHSGERKHPCKVCGKAFKTNYAARVHMRIHTQEKPFTCSLCSEGFGVKCLLKAHVARCHNVVDGTQ